MRRRLMVALTLVIATVVVVIIVPSALLVRRAARAEAQARIQRLAERVADLANSDLDRGRLDAQRIERVLPAETYAVITIGNGPSFSVGDRPAGAFLKSSVSEDQVHVVIKRRLRSGEANGDLRGTAASGVQRRDDVDDLQATAFASRR